MNSHHKNIKLTIEINPTRFLGTAFNVNLDIFTATKYFKNLERYKRNIINGDLHQAFEIASDFDAEVSTITEKYLDTGYPIGFIKSVISD